MLVLTELAKRKLALLGLIIIVIIAGSALLAPWIAPYDPQNQMFDGLTIEGAPMPPSAQFLLGTDLLGRDLLSRLMYGAQTSLIIGIVANGAAVIIGALVGVTAGFFQGWIGTILMRATDLMMAFPALLLAIVLAAIFTPSLWIVAMVIAMVNWVQVARVIYTETRSLSERDFIEAEWGIGASRFRILFKHMLPHLLSTMVVWATLGIATTVLPEATLSYLGVGWNRAISAGLTSSAIRIAPLGALSTIAVSRRPSRRPVTIMRPAIALVSTNCIGRVVSPSASLSVIVSARYIARQVSDGGVIGICRPPTV